ncbi:uncharacterized protein LOC118809988 [Colossoma macropomum]|uniref:uncharacterized protein LOC118809988 n=1 Tax=Colossoma macropomum TaxID=42526 RepID=UPI0018647316|nr:uncharacterized protein LOC118809988 [Colossoma macropomum]
MDMNVALHLLLTLAALITCSADGKSLSLCHKPSHRLQKRYAFLDSSVLTPQDEQRDVGCVEYDLRPAMTLPSHWVYLPQTVVVYLPRGSTQVRPPIWVPSLPGSFNLSQIINFTQRQRNPQPVVIYGRPLMPVNKLPPELEAFLRSYRVGQGAVGPGGVQPLVARPVNIIQLPRRGMSDLLDAVRRMLDFQKGGGFIIVPDAASPGSTTDPPPRPEVVSGHVYDPK